MTPRDLLTAAQCLPLPGWEIVREIDDPTRRMTIYRQGDASRHGGGRCRSGPGPSPRTPGLSLST